MIYKKLLRIYRKIRLTKWAILHLPRKLYIADTDYMIPAWDWRVALLCRVDSTVIKDRRMWYEPNEHKHFVDLLGDGVNVFYDIGAMIGYYCLLASWHGAKIVIGFEIIKEYADFANKVLKDNGINGLVIHTAIGSGDVYFEDELTSGYSPSLNLDEFARKYDVYPDAIKMDIEGHEYNALKQNPNILSKNPSLDISIHGKYLENMGYSEKMVLDLLKDYRIEKEFCSTYFIKHKSML